MNEIDIHADDFALTLNASKEMINCMKAGGLDSISLLPNMEVRDDCMGLLYQAIPTFPFLPRISVHLNFVEGKCLANAKEVWLLADRESSLIKCSWGRLFFYSYSFWKRKEFKKQLKKEIKAQIEAVQEAVRKCEEIAEQNQIPHSQKSLRIDSHQHPHMIPVIWEALVDVISEEGYEVEYIRNAKEVLQPFLSEVSLWKTYRPVNFVKNILLWLYSHKVDRYAEKHGMKKMHLWGLVMSGHMDYDRIVRMYPKMTARAKKENRTLEILFHPGISLSSEVTAELNQRDAKAFYLSKNRKVEQEAVLKLRGFL